MNRIFMEHYVDNFYHAYARNVEQNYYIDMYYKHSLKKQVKTIIGLRVWNSKEKDDMFWCPEFGDISKPRGWDFFPAGNAFMTRTLKKLGPHWILLRRRKAYTYNVGILCPASNIKKANKLEIESRTKREEKREQSKKYRDKREHNYRNEMEELMFSYLNFSKRYAKLAHNICSQAAEHATTVGSGRVGRTKQISMEDRAILAVRAHIRHTHTTYEKKLAKNSDDPDGMVHATLKKEANENVDEFIAKHRNSNK